MALAKVCKSWDSERAESDDICLPAAATCIPSDLMRVCVGQRRTRKTSGLWTLDAIDLQQFGSDLHSRSAMQRLVRLPNMALSGLSAAPSHS